MIIYKVTSRKTGKIYVGQTLRDLAIRKREHIRASWKTYGKHKMTFHAALSELGIPNFDWEILEECGSIDQLNEREKFYIKSLNTIHPNGYNQTSGGAVDGTMSEDIRNKISESVRKLHQDPTYTANLYPKLKGLTPPNKGQKMPKAFGEKISAINNARYADPNYVNPNVGQVRTEEQKANIRAGQEGNMCVGEDWTKAHGDQYTPEVRAKMRAAKVGKKPANTKQIQCIETGMIYPGLTEAAADTGAPRQSIWLQIKGKLKSAGGLHFKYL